MAVSDQARNELYNRFREMLGEEVAATMMELLPPAGWGDVARERDMALRFDVIGQRFDAVDRRFDSLETQIAQTNRFIGWMMATNAALVGVVTLVVTLAR
jgi:hypothetical protein